MKTLVVARYNEDLHWVKSFRYICDKVYIYNKGNPISPSLFERYNNVFTEDRKNIGRESETYLHYIISHYDTLDDLTIFLQGNPYDHCASYNLFERILTCDWKKDTQLISIPCDMEEDGSTDFIQQLYTRMFSNPVPVKIEFAAGAQCIVPRACIQARPKSYYEVLYAMLHHFDVTVPKAHVVDPWSIERVWKYLWNPSVPHKNISLDDFS